MAASLVGKAPRSKPIADVDTNNVPKPSSSTSDRAITKPEKSKGLPKPKALSSMRRTSTKSLDLNDSNVEYSNADGYHRKPRKNSEKNNSASSRTKHGNEILSVEVEKKPRIKSDTAIRKSEPMGNRLRDTDAPVSADAKLLGRRGSVKSTLSSGESLEGTIEPDPGWIAQIKR